MFKLESLGVSGSPSLGVSSSCSEMASGRSVEEPRDAAAAECGC